MSSTQSFTISFTKSNASTYLSGSNVTLGGSYVAVASIGKIGYATLNATAMAALYPNASVHPIKADIQMQHGNYGVDRMQFAGVQIFVASDKETVTRTNLTNSEIINSNRSTVVRFCIDADGSLPCRLVSAYITLYFTRYDFSASAGSNVTAASVSSSTGYDGDTVTFTATIPTGYVFDGWYSGSTLVSTSQSYTHTVNGADLALEARAQQNTHNVNGTYNGSTKAILNGISGNVTVSYNGRTATLNSSNTSHTLDCGGKMMLGNVSVGGTALQCGGKVMRSALVLNYV